jgi:hypothetical protein
MRNRIKIWEKGDEQMSHGKAAVLAVSLALLGTIALAMCSPFDDCKAADTTGSSACRPVPLGVTTPG